MAAVVGLILDAINAPPKIIKTNVLGSGTAVASMEKIGYPGCPKAVLPVNIQLSGDDVVAALV
jgi:hypothetical protein